MESYSQIGQDRWVFKHIPKTNGIFIDIGSYDGVELSNTYALEKMGWTGICFEPNKKSYEKLKLNRKCKTDPRAVYNVSGLTLNFYEADDPMMSGLFSNGSEQVQTISLNDIFEENKYKNVDYINLDTEGSELEILKTFNFNKYKVKCWTIEHNYTQEFNGIAQLLLGHNYLVKLHDWDFFAILDDVDPEHFYNYVRR